MFLGGHLLRCALSHRYLFISVSSCQISGHAWGTVRELECGHLTSIGREDEGLTTVLCVPVEIHDRDQGAAGLVAFARFFQRVVNLDEPVGLVGARLAALTYLV